MEKVLKGTQAALALLPSGWDRSLWPLPGRRRRKPLEVPNWQPLRTLPPNSVPVTKDDPALTIPLFEAVKVGVAVVVYANRLAPREGNRGVFREQPFLEHAERCQQPNHEWGRPN